MGSHAAMEVFSWCAFLQKEPPADNRSLAAAAVEACCGLPLTLTVLGAHLWTMKDSTAWDQALKRLQTAEPFPGTSREADRQLWGKLLLSFDDLGSREKQMFLDIACVMLGRHAQCCLPAWGELADSALGNLKNRSLVTLDGAGSLAMHDQLRDMGRAIVRSEHDSPGRRSRIWPPEADGVIQKHQVCMVWGTASLDCHRA